MGLIRGSAPRIAAVGLSLVLCGHARPLFAQTDQERAGARAVALEGVQAFQEERWADAVDLLTRAESLVHAPTHLLYLARAHQRLGHWVSAREAYLKLIRETIAPGAPRAFHDAQAAAKRELPSLEPKIPTLKVQISGADGKPVTVTIDGKPLPPALVGAANPIDPGTHRIEASAPGLVGGPVAVELKEGARETVAVPLRASTGEAPSLPAPAPAVDEPRSGPPTGGAMTSLEADEAPTTSSVNGLRIGSYVAMGVGVVGLAAGTYFGLQSKSKRDEANEICPNPKRCPVTEREEVDALDDDSGTAQQRAVIGFIAGGVGVAAGVTLFVLSGRRQEETGGSAPSASIRPWVSPFGLGVDGSF
jgi:hypothetical protein